MIMFKRGKVHNGTLVFAEPLSLPEGTEVFANMTPIHDENGDIIRDEPQELTPVSIGQTETSDEEKEDLLSLPIFGMWADREDMEDSVAWVRRQREGCKHQPKCEA